MANQAKVAEAYIELQLKLAQFKQSIGEASGEIKKFRAGMRAEMEASRASVRLVSEELGVHMPRALQGFVAKLPGVSAAMSAAFNAVAVFALIGIVVQAGEKIAEFVTKNQEAARKNGDANREFTSSLAKSNAELAVANDRLANDIAKLSHTPQNNLKLALDQAKLSAIELAEKLEAATTKERELLESANASWYQKAMGTEGTEGIKTGLDKYQSNYRNINLNYDQQAAAAKSLSDVEAIEVNRKKDLLSLTQSYYNALGSEIDRRKQLQTLADEAGGFHRDQSKSLPALENLQGRIGLDATGLSLDINHDQLQRQDTGLQAAKANSDAILEKFRQQLDQMESLHKLDVVEEIAFWQQKQAAFKQGSETYLAIQKQLAPLMQRDFQEKDDNQREYDRIQRSIFSDTDTEMQPKDDHGQTDMILSRLTAMKEMVQATKDAAAAQEEWNIKLAESTGIMSKQQAVIARDALAVSQLQARLAQQQANRDSATAAGSGQWTDKFNPELFQSQMNTTTGQLSIAQQQLALDQYENTAMGAVNSVFDTIRSRAQDTNQALAHIASQTLDSLNSEMAKSILGQKTNYKKVFEGASEQFTKTGLEKVEGSLLGIGGKLGTRGNPMFVQMANGGGSGSYTNELGDHIPGGNSSVMGASMASKGLLGILNNSNWASSLFGGKLFGSGSFFGGGFALGGDVSAGVPINVGEMGMERFTPSVPGHITPNKDLQHPSIGYIDARGTDPVQTQMAVQRGMVIAHATAVRDAKTQIAEHHRRTAH